MPTGPPSGHWTPDLGRLDLGTGPSRVLYVPWLRLLPLQVPPRFLSLTCSLPSSLSSSHTTPPSGKIGASEATGWENRSEVAGSASFRTENSPAARADASGWPSAPAGRRWRPLRGIREAGAACFKQRARIASESATDRSGDLFRSSEGPGDGPAEILNRAQRENISPGPLGGQNRRGAEEKLGRAAAEN